MKLCHVIGARPQFVKYYPVMAAERRLAEAGGRVEDVLVHTGQHYDYNMSRVFFDELGIKAPEHHLGVGSGTHAGQTAQVLERTEQVLERERPDAAIVYGDTNSTLGAALAAAKLGVPVVHVEAGLRSFNKAMPEEVNRVLADHVSSLLLCPSSVAVSHLRREGFGRLAAEGRLVSLEAVEHDPVFAEASADAPLVVNCGDVMFDVLRHAASVAEGRRGRFEELGLEPGGYAVLTLHRAENTDDPRRLGKLVDFVNSAAAGRAVVFPMHPRMRKAYDHSPVRLAGSVRVIEPLGYFDLLKLLRHSAMLLTDSGGMQKEAFWLRVPCVTLREETEWVETVQEGWNVLYRNFRGEARTGGDGGTPYGDGAAAERIVAVLARRFGGGAAGRR